METQLSVGELSRLRGELAREKFLNAASLGFCLRGQDNPLSAINAVVASIPESSAAAVMSVCGLKDFLVDEERLFCGPGTREARICCASVAVLDITDSPVHFHAETLEFYVVLAGTGKMVLNDRVVSVREGNIIVLPPGVHHGLASDDPQIPVKSLLIFTPGLAPKQFPKYRDERIVYDRAGDRIRELIQSGGIEP